MSRTETLNDLYRVSLEKHDRQEAFAYKQDGVWRTRSTRDFRSAGDEVARGLIAWGLKPGDRVAILSETRFEWGVTDYGILTAGLVNVPIYPTLSADEVEYILEDAGVSVLFAASPGHATLAAGYYRQRDGFRVVVFEPEEDASGMAIESFEALRKQGREHGERHPEAHSGRMNAVGPDDLATIIYTSGTTGKPKGVMLSHHNIASNVEAALDCIPLGPGDRCLSFLPLSHIFERMVGLYAMIRAGADVHYAESFQTVPENLIEVHPTVVVSVPRLYEKIYARVQAAAVEGGPLKNAIFAWARRVGLEWSGRKLARAPIGTGLVLRYKLADRLVFAKLRERTGGKLRFFVSGGAPLSAEITAFFYAAGLPIMEGYGLTETSPVLTVNRLDAIRPGTVGPTIPGVELQLAEDGEILARGPNIMLGYYNLPEETERALQGGWFHTGDVGKFDALGHLVITDRKKDIIVTAGGKNVAPQPIENRLKTDRFINEAVVIGDRRPYLVALIVPDFEALAGYCQVKGIDAAGPQAMVAHPKIHGLIQRRIDLHQAGAPGFRSIRKFHLLDSELVLGEDLTPTLKVKRSRVAEKFAVEIEALYNGERATA